MAMKRTASGGRPHQQPNTKNSGNPMFNTSRMSGSPRQHGNPGKVLKHDRSVVMGTGPAAHPANPKHGKSTNDKAK